MSEEDDCIVVSLGDDDSNDDDDDVEVVVIQDIGTDLDEDSFSDDEVLILTDSEDDSDVSGELLELSLEIEDFTALNGQVVSCLASLKRGNPDSEEVESMPLYKKGRPSIPEDDYMENNAPEDLFDGNHHNLLDQLQRYCQNLNELTEIVSSQINHLRGIVSEMQRFLGSAQILPCGDGNPPSPAERQENDAETNPGGASLQSAASPELQQLALSDSPSLLRIVPMYSLQPSHDSDSPFSRLSLSSIFSEGDEHINSDLSSPQGPLAEPIADLPQAESSLPDNFETVGYSTINNRMSPDTALPSLYFAPNFEVAETSLENNPETMSYSTLSGNDSGLSSSVNVPPNFGVEKLILTQMPIKEETGVENSSQTVYYPALLGHIVDLSTDSPSHSVPPNFAFEKVILIEIPGQAETTVGNSYQIVGNETVMGNETEVGNDGNPDTGSSPLSILPRVETVVKAETSLESDTPVMNQPPFLEYDSDEGASYIFIPSDVESGIEMSSEAENHAGVIKNDSDQQIDSESFFLVYGFVFVTKNTAKTQPPPSKAAQRSMQSPQNSTVVLPTHQTKKSGRPKPSGYPSVPKKGSSVKNTTTKKKGPHSGRKEKCIPVVCSTSSTSLKALARERGNVSYDKDAVPGSSKIVMSTVCVYINKHGNCGPHLDQKKIQQLPDHFGPGPVNVVLRRTVQACVDCAIQSKTVFGFLKPDHRGGEVITAAFDGEVHSIQLPPVNSASFVLRFLENLCHSLQCDNLLSSQPFSSYRGNTHSPEENDQNKPVEEDITEKKITKRPSEQPLPYVAPLSPKQPKIIVPASKEEVLPSEEDSMAKEEKLSEESNKSPPSSANSLSPARKNSISTHTPVSMNDSQSMPCISSPKVVETKSSIKSSQLEVEFEMQRESEVEAPSYMAVPDPSVLKQGFSKDPATWSVDEVIQFMKHKDPEKSGPLAELFRQHEIDGKALLLLKSDVIMKYMGLKLGPALKLCYYIEKLKEGKYN